MKSLLIALLLVSGSAMAQDATAVAPFQCVIPVESGDPVVKLEVNVAPDESIDFVTLTLTGPKTHEVLFTQLEKGTVKKGLDSGALSMLVLQEGFSQENGVLKKAGIFSVNKNAQGALEGVLLALGNLYPLYCN